MNADERAVLVQATLALADDLEYRYLYPGVGLIRQLAQIVATTPVKDTTSCPVCGQPIPITVKGRRRIYCCDSCKRKASRTRVADVVTMVTPVARPAAQDDLGRVVAYQDPVGEEAVGNVMRAW